MTMYLIHKKSKVIDIYEMYINKFDRQLDWKVKIIRFDKDDEFFYRYDESEYNIGSFC